MSRQLNPSDPVGTNGQPEFVALSTVTPSIMTVTSTYAEHARDSAHETVDSRVLESRQEIVTAAPRQTSSAHSSSSANYLNVPLLGWWVITPLRLPSAVRLLTKPSAELSWSEIHQFSSSLTCFTLKGQSTDLYTSMSVREVKRKGQQSVTTVVSHLLWLWRGKKQKNTAIVFNRNFECIMGNVGSSGFGAWPILKVKIPQLLLLWFWPFFFKCNTLAKPLWK